MPTHESIAYTGSVSLLVFGPVASLAWRPTGRGRQAPTVHSSSAVFLAQAEG